MKTLLTFLILLISLPSIAGVKTNKTKLIENLEIRPNSKIYFKVSEFRTTISYQGKDYVSNDCSGKILVNLSISKKIDFYPVCSQVYGGVIRLQNIADPKPNEGFVIGKDWGDEGCLEKTTGILEVKKNGSVAVQLEVQRSGKMAEGTEADCSPGLKKEEWIYDRSRKAFIEAMKI